jgi:hypothetical protein
MRLIDYLTLAGLSLGAALAIGAAGSTAQAQTKVVVRNSEGFLQAVRIGRFDRARPGFKHDRANCRDRC